MSVLVLLVLVAAAACTKAADKPRLPSVQDKLVEAGLNDNRKLRIGVYDWQPVMGYLDRNGAHRGFDVDVARYIAGQLGYDEGKIEWVRITNVADRITFLQQGKVDLVVASFSITEPRRQHVNFAGPYLVTEQSVMINKNQDGTIRTIDDFSFARMCTSTGSTSEKLLKERGVAYQSLDSDDGCYQGMLHGLYDAMSSDRTVLMGFKSKSPGAFVILDTKLATADNPGDERLGIGVPLINPALRELVDYFLCKTYRAQQRGEVTGWQLAYRQYLADLGSLAQPSPDQCPKLLDFDSKSAAR